MKKIIGRIKCFFGFHDWKAISHEYEPDLKCRRCGRISQWFNRT